MTYQLTTATTKLLKLNRRLRFVCGGTSAGKTISILQIFIDKCQSDRSAKLRSVVSESFPHLKRGAMRDFLNIMQEHGYFNDKQWNKSDFIYTFETGSKLEFFSADMPSKVRGPRRDDLFINEANNIPLEAFEQLEVRTKETIWCDWNPTNEFWAYEYWQDKNYDGVIDFITLTYNDNEALDQEIVKSIERRKNNKNWWRVYGLGQLGEVEGKIFTNWKIIDDIPHEARLERRYLDFGYSADPSAIGEIYYYNGGWILNELLYQKGMSNKQLADFLNNLQRKETLVIADSAEPKSIDEIRSYGINIIGSKKGKDSVKNSIQLIQDQPVSVTKSSINIIKEQRGYFWMTDKNGKIINEEDPNCPNHHMAGIRYAMQTLGRVKQEASYWDRVFSDDLEGKTKKSFNKEC